MAVPVGDGRFGPLSSVPRYVLVQIGKAAGHGLCDVT